MENLKPYVPLVSIILSSDLATHSAAILSLVIGMALFLLIQSAALIFYKPITAVFYLALAGIATYMTFIS